MKTKLAISAMLVTAVVGQSLGQTAPNPNWAAGIAIDLKTRQTCAIAFTSLKGLTLSPNLSGEFVAFGGTVVQTPGSNQPAELIAGTGVELCYSVPTWKPLPKLQVMFNLGLGEGFVPDATGANPVAWAGIALRF